MRVATIFEIEGEPAFRERERKTIAELAERQNIVLATGGSAVTHPDTRRVLAQRHGDFTCAPASTTCCCARKTTKPPAAANRRPRAKLESLFAQRDPLYREVADIIIDTSRQNVHLLVSRLLQSWRTTAPCPSTPCPAPPA